MPELLELSNTEIVYAGVSTAFLSLSLLYLNAILMWRKVKLPKVNRPTVLNIKGNLNEYISMFKRWKQGSPTYVNDSTWVEQLGLPKDASPLKILTKIEAQIDASEKARQQSTLRHAVLLEFQVKARNLMNVKGARQRLLADQKATADIEHGTETYPPTKKPTVSSDHPITRALKSAQPLQQTTNAMPQAQAIRVLGLTKLSGTRALTKADVRTAYKSKKRSARKSVVARLRLEQAYHTMNNWIA